MFGKSDPFMVISRTSPMQSKIEQFSNLPQNWRPLIDPEKGATYLKSTGLWVVPPKVFNNKSCCNFGYEHKIAFCTAVQNLSQIGQPSFFTFSWGPPFANLWIFVYWHFMSKSKDLQRGDPMKKWKMKVVWFGSNFAQLYKM